MILALRTDTAMAELFLLDPTGTELAKDIWEAGRNLSTELLGHITSLLRTQKASWTDVSGVIVFRGPGSFTGLRIGVTVANTIAYGQSIPMAGVDGKQWVATGVSRLAGGHNDVLVLPEYGAEPNITQRPNA